MQLTTNTRAFIEADIQSMMIITNLHDGLLGEQFYRNVTDFGNGETLHIPTIGSVTLQEAAEDTPLVYNPIETGEVTLTISEHVGDAWYITDDLREDGFNIDALMSARSVESTRSFQEFFETDFLDTACSYFAAGGPGDGSPVLVNGFAHHIVSTGSSGAFQLSQLIKMRLAFDKANVPAMGRVAIVDGVVEATLTGLVTITSDISAFAVDVIKNGMASGNRLMMSLYGFDVMTSNRLKVSTYNDGTTTIADGVGNLAMCILDDNTKPIMGAWRRKPTVEGERNKDRRRDEYTASARWGFGIQRIDTLGCFPTSSTAIENA